MFDFLRPIYTRLHTRPSLLMDAKSISEQEVRSQQGQDGLPWGPSQAVCLIHTQSMGSQCLQGGTAAVSASVWRQQNGAQGAVEETQLLLHLAQLSQEFLSRKIRMHLNSNKSGKTLLWCCFWVPWRAVVCPQRLAGWCHYHRPSPSAALPDIKLFAGPAVRLEDLDQWQVRWITIWDLPTTNIYITN